MGRKEDLEKHIQDSYDLIREYELLRLSSDPKEKTRARRVIDDQRQLILGWSAEYEQLSGHHLPTHMIEPVDTLASSEERKVNPQTKEQWIEVKKPVPKLGYLFLTLLIVNLFVVLVLGWKWFGDQPALLAYLQVVTGFLSLTLEILLLGIALQKQMSFEDVLRWLGTNRLWQGIISIVTIALLGVLLWPQWGQPFNQADVPSDTPVPQETAIQTPIVITTTHAVMPTPWSPCRIDSFVAEPPSPQPVGGLVIFKIRGMCEPGVRAIRLSINDVPHGEKGGHEAPPGEFVPVWSTKLEPGDYRITAEIATWGDDDWALASRQTLTYTLVPLYTPTNTSLPAAQPWFGPISFCLALNNDNSCLFPINHLPAGTTRFYVSWPFKDVPLGTPFQRVWYRDGKRMEISKEDIWDNDWNSPTGVEYTFLDNEEGFPNGEYTLELYLEQVSDPIQRATVRIGP